MGVEPEENPEIAEHLRATREQVRAPLPARERRAEALVGAGAAVCALSLALFLPGETDWDVPLVVGLVIAYAVAARVRIEFSTGHTDVSLLVLPALLLFAPPGWVPLLVMAGWLLSRAPEYARGQVHPDRALTALGNSAHALGPAFVLAAAGPGDAALGDWPLYAAALLAQFATDTVAGVGREWLAEGVRPKLQLRIMASIYALDAVLAPVGLLIAIAMEREPLALLLAAPLTVVLGAYAKERRTRLGHALELLESELEVERARAEVFAALSHGLQTPLAAVTGLARTLDRHGDALDAQRRRQVAGSLHREAVLLRHVVRQALDFEAISRGEPLRVRVTDVDLAAAAQEVAALHPGVEVRGEGHARGDASRVQQVVLALVANAIAATPVDAPAPVIDVTGGAITVSDAGPGVPLAERPALFAGRTTNEHEAAGTGVGLAVARAAARAMDGDLSAAFPADGGSRFTLALAPIPALAPAERP